MEDETGHIFAIRFILHVFIFHLVSLPIADIDTLIESNAQANVNREQCKRLMIYMPDNYSDVSSFVIEYSSFLYLWYMSIDFGSFVHISYAHTLIFFLSLLYTNYSTDMDHKSIDI